jgi:hypothetical protein
MGAYQVREDGLLARHSVSYAEELHPLLPAVPGDDRQELVK